LEDLEELLADFIPARTIEDDIIDVLKTGPKTIHEIARAVDIRYQKIYYWIRKLIKAGIIVSFRKGRRTFYDLCRR